jgi:dipeptidase E
MRLLLSSGGNNSLSSKQKLILNAQIEELFRGIDEVVFISYAQKKRIEYTTKVREKSWPLKNIKLIGIEEYDNPYDAVKNAKGIYVGGGNSFLLTHGLHENKLIKILNDVIISGIPYLGVSAGTNIACPTMMTTNDMPIIMPKKLDTLNLVNFQINPHYHEGPMWLKNEEGFVKHNGETRSQRINEYHQNNIIPVIGLFEGSLIKWQNQKGKLMIGDAVIFHKGKLPKKIKNGTYVNNNLEII